MNNPFGNLMQQLMGAGSGPAPAVAQDQFHQLAQATPPDILSRGLTEAFNSEHTPEFGTMVAHMFGQANPAQKTGIVNRLLSGVGPAAVGLLSQLGFRGLASQGDSTPQLSTEQAAQLSTGQVQQIATHAQSVNPGIVESMSNFYAQHPVLVKTLGAAALAIIASRIGHRAA